jgi:hypothetical protein
MSDSKKITAKTENIILFINYFNTEIPEGKIAININHVLYARPARDEEIEHARIHGW